jgi:hypothetical protein
MLSSVQPSSITLLIERAGEKSSFHFRYDGRATCRKRTGKSF